MKAVSTEANAVDFTWQNSDFNNYRGADDQVILVTYSPETMNLPI
jgi:hypothetical protein